MNFGIRPVELIATKAAKPTRNIGSVAFALSPVGDRMRKFSRGQEPNRVERRAPLDGDQAFHAGVGFKTDIVRATLAHNRVV